MVASVNAARYFASSRLCPRLGSGGRDLLAPADICHIELFYIYVKRRYTSSNTIKMLLPSNHVQHELLH